MANNLSLENNIKHLNMMFEISTIANQADDVYELLEKIKEYCANITNCDDFTFYLLEGQRYKCVIGSNDHIRSSEFVEGDEGNVAFWDAMNSAKVIAKKDGGIANAFQSFLENFAHLSRFFLGNLPINTRGGSDGAENRFKARSAPWGFG